MLHLQWSQPLNRNCWKKVLFSRTVTTDAGQREPWSWCMVLHQFHPARRYRPGPADATGDGRLGLCPLTAVHRLHSLCLRGSPTGHRHVAFVGASLPIVLSLNSGPSPAPGTDVHGALAFGFGYAGMILSPVHVCLIVSV